MLVHESFAFRLQLSLQFLPRRADRGTPDTAPGTSHKVLQGDNAGLETRELVRHRIAGWKRQPTVHKGLNVVGERVYCRWAGAWDVLAAIAHAIVSAVGGLDPGRDAEGRDECGVHRAAARRTSGGSGSSSCNCSRRGRHRRRRSHRDEGVGKATVAAAAAATAISTMVETSSITAATMVPLSEGGASRQRGGEEEYKGDRSAHCCDCYCFRTGWIGGTSVVVGLFCLVKNEMFKCTATKGWMVEYCTTGRE